MSFAEYLAGRARSDAAVAKLAEDMSALQVRMADRLVDLLLTLDTVGKFITSSDANVAKVSEIIGILKSEMVDPEWVDAVSLYLDSFDAMEDDIVRYMASLGDDVDTALIGGLKRHYKGTITEFLTTPQSFAESLFNPLAQNIVTSVIQGGALADLTSSTRDIIKGGEEGDGAIVDTAKGMAETSATLYERSATSKLADELEIDIYFYQGRNIDTTRPFCRERSGHAWHRTEIEAWADEDWAGKVEGTDSQTIFVYLGGWFGAKKACRHVLIPISIDDAPKADVARMRSKGFV